MTLNVLSLDKQTHTLVRRPQCPHCGDPRAVTVNQSASLVLQSGKKSLSTMADIAASYQRDLATTLTHHISPITGIVGASARPLRGSAKRASRLRSSLRQNFVYMPQEDSLDLAALAASLKSGSGGKGQHATQAKVSALREAIERYSGTFQGDESRLRARLKDLR